MDTRPLHTWRTSGSTICSKELVVPYYPTRELVVPCHPTRELVVPYYPTRELVVPCYPTRGLVVPYCPRTGTTQYKHQSYSSLKLGSKMSNLTRRAPVLRAAWASVVTRTLFSFCQHQWTCMLSSIPLSIGPSGANLTRPLGTTTVCVCVCVCVREEME
ncbi:hypothetical protein EYF80_055754 [Liparis tanakae]|uniref:Uncharacterized protein n=1 Tax=Liparis tanakae TaxID=230148 RepID=A0A4Z2F0R4_9TELE|nr:hypothetical protein EYF80_055754 [Liparis tanakae]